MPPTLSVLIATPASRAASARPAASLALRAESVSWKPGCWISLSVVSPAAAAHHLAQRGEIRGDAVQALGAVQRHAETGHHLIVDQQRALLLGERAQRL